MQYNGFRSIREYESECARLGFTTIVLPKENLRHLKAPEGVTLRGVDTVYQALSVLF